MSSAKAGHNALDAAAGVRGELADQPDNETRGRFVRAALAHAEEQLNLMEEQAAAVALRAAEVIEAWQAKADEAIVIREAAADERDRWQTELDELTGF